MKLQEIADALAKEARRLSPQQKLDPAEVPMIDALAVHIFERYPKPKPYVPPGPAELTARVALELVGHEAIVLEAYKDSKGIWTWGIGVTDRSGHSVGRYKDAPQTVEHVLAVYIWLLRNRYIPDVLKAFAGIKINEAQFAAALSFHYNTGAIGKTDWVKLFRQGKDAEARKFLETHYLNEGDLEGRRKAEAALFFDGVWTEDGKATIIPVRKPSYQPNFRQSKRVDIRADLDKVLAAG